MQLFYAPDLVPPIYTLPEEEGRHAVRVLRMSVGDTVHLADGRGTLYEARIVEAGHRLCTVEVTAVHAGFGKRGYGLTMAVAPTKNAERYDWFLEKATEVGVDTVIPVECSRSERRTLNAGRADKIVTSAMKQSVKAYRPEVEAMQPFEAVIGRKFGGRKLIAHCNEAVAGKRKLAEVVSPGDDALILIGPEGDFSPAEVEAAVAAGFEEITLGGMRLRTETAALAAVMNMAFINQ